MNGQRRSKPDRDCSKSESPEITACIACFEEWWCIFGGSHANNDLDFLSQGSEKASESSEQKSDKM